MSNAENSSKQSIGETPKEMTELSSMVSGARSIALEMNEVNDLYEFGRPATDEEEERIAVGQDEKNELEEKWEALNSRLVRVCEDIYRIQGGEEARKTVIAVLKNIHHHLSGETSEMHRFSILDTILMNITKK